MSDSKPGIRTTIMLRNLPNDYSRSKIIDMLDSAGFSGHYDFVYVPVDFRRWAGFGYAFVNMISTESAEYAMQQFKGFKDWSVGSEKICSVSWGEPIQGLSAHIERYRNSPVMHEDVPDEFRPAIFLNGLRAEFPAPTKRIQAPRLKLSKPSARSAFSAAKARQA